MVLQQYQAVLLLFIFLNFFFASFFDFHKTASNSLLPPDEMCVILESFLCGNFFLFGFVSLCHFHLASIFIYFLCHNCVTEILLSNKQMSDSVAEW